MSNRQISRGPVPQGGRWRLPLRITERAGVDWRGERIGVGVALPPSSGAVALRLHDESTGQDLPCGAVYGGWSAAGQLRWCQLALPLHLRAGEQGHLALELLDDPQLPGAILPSPPGATSVDMLDLSAGPAGIHWQQTAAHGPLAVPLIQGIPLVGAHAAWCQVAMADQSAPTGVVGGHLPLEEGEQATLFLRAADPHLTVVDLQRRLNRGAGGAGYDLRQVHLYDLPGETVLPERPYALCDLVLRVHAGRDGTAVAVDGLTLLLGVGASDEFVWQARGDAAGPRQRREPWAKGLGLPPGDWLLARRNDGQALLVIPWSAYTLDGYDLSFPAWAAGAAPGHAALAIALARGHYKLAWGTPGHWGRNTYEFSCRLAWGAIDEATAARLARGYRRPPRVQVGEIERQEGPVAVRLWLERFTFAPGESVNAEVEVVTSSEQVGALPAATAVALRLQHRGEELSHGPAAPLAAGPKGWLHGLLQWTAPATAGGGYLLSARVAALGATASSPAVSVEVLRRPEDLATAVRMATICELYPDRDPEVLADRLADARINVAWLRNVFAFGQYTAPSDGSWDGAEACMISDIGRLVRIDANHLRRFVAACRARGITTIVYGNLRNIEASVYAEAQAAGLLGPEDVDVQNRRWPYPDVVNHRGRAESPRWERHLVGQLSDGMRRFGYDGYFFDNTSYRREAEAELAHRIIQATRAVRPDQCIMENPGPPAQDAAGGRVAWPDPRDAEIVRWPEVACALMEVQCCARPEDIVAFARMFRRACDTKTPVLYLHDPSRRSPAAHLLRLGHALAGKATEDLCSAHSSHDGALFFEQCPVSAALTRTLYSGLVLFPELLEAGPLLAGVEVSGLGASSVLAYDGLAAGGLARTVIIANRHGYAAPLRTAGYYWDGPTPAVQPAPGVTVTLPIPRGRPILGAWLVRPEGWSEIDWQLASDERTVTFALGEVHELAALAVRWKA